MIWGLEWAVISVCRIESSGWSWNYFLSLKLSCSKNLYVHELELRTLERPEDLWAKQRSMGKGLSAKRRESNSSVTQELCETSGPPKRSGRFLASQGWVGGGEWAFHGGLWTGGWIFKLWKPGKWWNFGGKGEVFFFFAKFGIGSQEHLK